MKAFTLEEDSQAVNNREFTDVAVPTGHDLTTAAADWSTMSMNVEAHAFE